ncbi:MAG: hypothetical protein AAGF12_12560 [Myxococcota bacterium]
MRTGLGLLLVVFCIGCEGDFVPGSTIERLRLIGAVIADPMDETLVDVRPGVDTEITLLTAAPDAVPTASFVAFACDVGDIDPQRGPLCGSPPFQRWAEDPGTAAPRFVLSVPGNYVGLEVLIQGLLCPTGAPVTEIPVPDDGVLSRDDCQLGLGTLFSLNIPVASPEWPNQNPVFTADAIGLDGVTWTDAGGECGSPEERLVAPGQTVRLRIGPLPDEEREVTSTGERERLLVSHFTSGGELDRQFSFVDDVTPMSEVEWFAPANAPPDGLTVHFNFVVRDGRFGSDRIRRRLCVR